MRVVSVTLVLRPLTKARRRETPQRTVMLSQHMCTLGIEAVHDAILTNASCCECRICHNEAFKYFEQINAKVPAGDRPAGLDRAKATGVNPRMLGYQALVEKIDDWKEDFFNQYGSKWVEVRQGYQPEIGQDNDSRAV